MEEQYVDENFEIQTRTKDETQIELEKVTVLFFTKSLTTKKFGDIGSASVF